MFNLFKFSAKKYQVKLDYLLERETFDSIQNWHEVLSGGEKQRVALAR